MPRGGHGRSGPPAKDAATRALHGSATRSQHRTKGDPGAAMVSCDPPPGLSKLERKFWDYYATHLRAERRLTMKARDTLAKYCTALAVVAGLRATLGSRKKADIADRSSNRKELRQWLLASRLYENDLLLNPSSSMRAVKPTGDDPNPDPPPPDDPFNEFDDEDDGASVN